MILPATFNIRMVRGDDRQFRFEFSPPIDITGMTFTFSVRDVTSGQSSTQGTSRISKTVGSGLTITDGPRGILTLTLDAADTSSLDASEAYTWQLKRTGSGTVKTCGKGTFTLDLDDA